MRLKEQRLFDSMKRNAPPEFWIQRIENSVGTGIPDTYIDGVWIELKAPIAPKRKTTRLLGNDGLNLDQINWHLKASSRNIPSFILIRDDLMRLALVSGFYANEINDMSWDEIASNSFASTWPEFFFTIKNHIWPAQIGELL